MTKQTFGRKHETSAKSDEVLYGTSVMENECDVDIILPSERILCINETKLCKHYAKKISVINERISYRRILYQYLNLEVANDVLGHDSHLTVPETYYQFKENEI